jgi:hypothetical protein
MFDIKNPNVIEITLADYMQLFELQNNGENIHGIKKQFQDDIDEIYEMTYLQAITIDGVELNADVRFVVAKLIDESGNALLVFTEEALRYIHYELNALFDLARKRTLKKENNGDTNDKAYKR